MLSPSLALLLSLTHVADAENTRSFADGSYDVIDADLIAGTILFELKSSGPDLAADAPEDAPPYDRCKNAFLGSKGIELVVVDVAVNRVLVAYELAGWPEKGPCATQASYDKARADAKAKIKADYKLDIDRKDRPAAKKLGGSVTVMSDPGGDDDIFRNETRSFHSGSARLASSFHSWGTMAGGYCNFDERIFEDDGRAVVVQATSCGSMRGGDGNWRTLGPLKLPSNGVNVEAISKLKLDDKRCGISIAANAGLDTTVAQTVGYALATERAPITVSLKEREKSVVFTKPECDATAKALAALVPGGASVEPLTWKAQANIVVAIGKSAAIR